MIRPRILLAARARGPAMGDAWRCHTAELELPSPRAAPTARPTAGHTAATFVLVVDVHKHGPPQPLGAARICTSDKLRRPTNGMGRCQGARKFGKAWARISRSAVPRGTVVRVRGIETRSSRIIVRTLEPAHPLTSGEQRAARRQFSANFRNAGRRQGAPFCPNPGLEGRGARNVLVLRCPM